MAETGKMSDVPPLTSLKDEPYRLTYDHYAVFGAIVQWFARFEKLIEINIH